jgi:hypothetical protein
VPPETDTPTPVGCRFPGCTLKSPPTNRGLHTSCTRRAMREGTFEKYAEPLPAKPPKRAPILVEEGVPGILDEIRAALGLDAGASEKSIVPAIGMLRTTDRLRVQAQERAREEEARANRWMDAARAAEAKLAAIEPGHHLAIDALRATGERAPDGTAWEALPVNDLLGALAEALTGFRLRAERATAEADCIEADFNGAEARLGEVCRVLRDEGIDPDDTLEEGPAVALLVKKLRAEPMQEDAEERLAFAALLNMDLDGNAPPGWEAIRAACRAVFAEEGRLRGKLAETIAALGDGVAKRDDYWALLCRTVEAMGKVSPEAAPYADQWAGKLRADLDAERARAEGLERDLTVVRAQVAEVESSAAASVETIGPDTVMAVARACRADLFRALGGGETEDVPAWDELLRRVQELDSEAPEVLAARAARGLELRALALSRRAAALREIAGGEVAHG